MKRCNLEETDSGVRLCRGNHEKHAPCEWEYFVPAYAVAAEHEACVKTCEACEDTGNDIGIERDVAVWNKAVAYCVRRLKERSNSELSPPLGGNNRES